MRVRAVRLTLKLGVMVHLFLAGYSSNALHGQCVEGGVTRLQVVPD